MDSNHRFGPLLRDDGDGSHRVTPMELFFDLVFVFAVTQLSHLLLDQMTVHGTLQTVLLLLAVWTGWIYTTWTTNWLDPNQFPVRVMLVVIMAGSLVMSAVLPEAFGERGLLFAATIAAMQVGRTLFVVFCMRDHPVQFRNFQRILAWVTTGSLLWIAGGLAEGQNREVLWLMAVAIDYLGPIALFYTPGLGHSSTQEWNISGEHMAERCQLFVIIALGESILVTGATFGEMELSWPILAALVVALLGSVALWWVYFDRSAAAAAEAIAHAADPGMLGRSAYTYFHLPMIAGIIVVAAGDELSIAHPLDPAGVATAAAILGGPALFLAGHLLFKRAIFGIWSGARLGAIVVLVLLIVLGSEWSPLVLATISTLIVATVPLLDALWLRQHDHAVASAAQIRTEGVQ